MSPIPTAAFGRTGHESTRTIFGAAALGRVTQAEADDTLQLLLQYGINHIDTAASYGDAELRIGPWMDTMRGHFFLATKTGERSYQAAHDQIRRSLERMHVSQIDLIQLHNLVDESEWDQAMGDDGALKAAIEARDEGLVRFIGVTGHGVPVAEMHRRSLERFDFDTVLLPYNYLMMKNERYARDFETLAALCKERNVAMQTIKSATRRPWEESASHYTSTWYEPFTDQVDIALAVNWVLGNPQVFLNTLSDIHVLPKVLAAASQLTHRPGDGDMDALVAREAAAPLFV
jgi:aryl-alcohol dehydrogenase-like predicted oxidoreductase